MDSGASFLDLNPGSIIQGKIRFLSLLQERMAPPQSDLYPEELMSDWREGPYLYPFSFVSISSSCVIMSAPIAFNY